LRILLSVTLAACFRLGARQSFFQLAGASMRVAIANFSDIPARCCDGNEESLRNRVPWKGRVKFINCY
jgi:hypothetical protein